MKTNIQLIFFLLFFVFSKQFFAQNDSLKPKTDTIKLIKKIELEEDFFALKKKKFTYFVSNRYSEDNKYDIFKSVPYLDMPPSVIVVRGHLEVLDNPKLKKARMSIYNASNNELVGLYNTNQYTGNYLLILVPNVRYFLKLDIAGYGSFKELIEVPLKIDYEVCQQEIKVKMNAQKKGIVAINNFFEDESDRIFYLKSIADSTKIISTVGSQGPGNSGKDPKFKKQISNIDELVKSQVDEERKKPAEALAAYKSKDYETAVTLYAALLKNDKADPFANYYYGMSLIKSGKSKVKAIGALQNAALTKDVPYDVHYHLGVACHLSYLFTDALIALDEFKKRAKPIEVATSNVAQLIKNCQSGNELIANQINIEILKRWPANEIDLLSNYEAEVVNEKIRLKTDAFNSLTDRKKNTKLFLTNFHNREFIHVSYNDKTPTQSDLFKNAFLPNGKMSANQLVSEEINTPYDENYPYLSKDGLTLYFSSKGHNSIGGYDIFKCIRPDTLSGWGKPENMGYPINSTYDDVLFIPDSNGAYATFCTNRKSEKMEMLHIKLPQKENNYLVIKGNFSTQDSIPTKDAIITIYNNKTTEIAGVYKTNSQTGMYLMILASNSQYNMIIETPGYPELKGSFELPEKKGDYQLKQIIKCTKEKLNKSIKITNYFTEYEASRVNLDPTPAKTDNGTMVGGASTKAAKNKNMIRTPSEAEKDVADLNLADNLFNQSLYQEASAIYYKLDAVIALSGVHCYNYGVCIYLTKKERMECIRNLENSVTVKDVPYNVHYYLGKAYYENYQFSDAIKCYQKFISLCKQEEKEKYSIDKEIAFCNNGITLINNPTLIMEVYEKKHADINALQNSLSQAQSGGKVLLLTDDLRSLIDKKKNFKSLFYLAPDKTTIYITSYGETETNSKDIYRLKKLGNGKWSAPMPIEGINSGFDEEFPCLSKDGRTLYFSSKGYNSMGGYDIYKSTWDDKLEAWSKPINLGAPINSPFDDMFFLE
jgi:tetratricopeptide (TPR) repeat protein